MPLPRLPAIAVLILSLACSLVWGRPPVKSQKGSTAVRPSAQQPENETVSGFLPGASGMEANLPSTLCSGLWTSSTPECFFLPNPQLSTQPGTSARSEKQLTQAGKLKVHSQRNPRGKNQLTQSGKRMDIMKGNLAGQLTTPMPHYKCRFFPKTYKTRGRHTNHENQCKNRPQPEQSEPVPIVSPSPDNADPNEEFMLDEEPALTLAEYSRLVAAYMEQPEWQNFLDSGRHVTTETTAVKTGWNGLTLDTVSPADEQTPFPDLTPSTLDMLMQLSPTIHRLNQELQTGKDPLADNSDLKAFLSETDQNSGELFARGSHSLIIKWHKGPGYVFKIARSQQDQNRLNREKNLYLWLRKPENILLNLTTTPMRAAFSMHGKPVLALRQVDGTVRDMLRLMREHSLNERLDFALSVIMHFCQMYRRFLEKDVLLADRHDDNIGFNEIPLPGRKSMGLDDAIIQVPVMLDLDPYWFGDQETREIKLHLPTWVPVVVGLLEEVFTPVNSDCQISESRLKAINKIRQFASPVFSSSSSSALQVTEEGDIEPALQSCTEHWFQAINPEHSNLLAEARYHIERLLTSLSQWDSTPLTVAEWNKKLLENIGEVRQWLNNWKNETEFSLLNDFTDEGIIRAYSLQRGTSSQDQQILTLLSMIHGRLGCQKCSRTFTKITDSRRHLELHQKKKLGHCEICGGDFTNITDHRRVHTGEKPYRCEHCGKGFSLNNHLQIHLRTHSGDRPYKCKHCDKCFSQINSLQTHLRTHSGDKPYQCEHCGKCFSQSAHLKCHLSTHSGEKPYRCGHCRKNFSDSSNLQKHLRTHSGDKPYQCKHCGRCFSQSGNLKSHLRRTHSGDKPTNASTVAGASVKIDT